MGARRRGRTPKQKVTWRQELSRRWGIVPLDEPPPPRRDCFWVSRCSKIKAGRETGTPEELYQSNVNRYFFAFVRRHGLRHGILSDLYGLHLDCERLKTYDVHPSQLTAEHKFELGRLVGEKVRSAGFGTLVFYNNSPIRSRPYFEILAAADLRVFYTTRLRRDETP